MHATEAVWAEKVPAAHASQLEAPAVAWYCPASQLVQTVAPAAAEYAPLGQRLHDISVRPALEPAGQGAQAARPLDEAKVPAPQVTQVDATLLPVAPELVPERHKSQLDDPEAA